MAREEEKNGRLENPDNEVRNAMEPENAPE